MGDKAIQQKRKVLAQKLQNHQKIAVQLIKQLTSTQKSKKIGQQTKLRILSDLNANLIQIQKISPIKNQMFADQKLIVFVRYFMIDNSNFSKIPPLQFFRLILVSNSVADRFITHSLPLYIARVIQRDDSSRNKSPLNSHFDQQVFEALRLIKHWIQKFPLKFPQYLAFCLVALADLPVAMSIEQKKKDQIPQHIKTFAIDILLIMSSKNTKLCCICGGFNLLMNAITDPAFNQKSYDIISKMLVFINDSKYRQMTSAYIDFKKVFHVLTDLDNVFLQQGYKSRNNLQMLSRFQGKLSLAKSAIITLLKSWVGLIYIGNQPTSVHALLQTLKQVPKKYDSDLRNLIFQALEQIISVGDSIITSSTTQQKHSFKISNLIGCYLMTVVELLIQQNLLRILIQLSGVEEPLVSQPSQRLLKRLTFLIFSYRPQYSKYIDFLITAANKTSNSSQVLKTSSSFVINKIGNYIYDKKEKKNHPMFNELQNLFSLKSIFVPYSRASLNSISKTLNFINYKQKQQYRKNLLQKQPITKQHKQNYLRWKWDVIQNLLQFPDPDKFKPSTNQRYRQNKMYKYLLRFYSPSRGNFYKLDWHMANFTYIKAGMLLIRNSITIAQNLPLIKNPPQSQFQCTVSFVGDLQKLLQINIKECVKNSNNWNIVLSTKLQRQLMSFIGLLSQTKTGYDQLICQNRFLQLLNQCLKHSQCSHLVYLILINFDFYRDDVVKVLIKNQNGTNSVKYYSANAYNQANKNDPNQIPTKIGVRHLLQTCIKQGSEPLKLACIEIIKILLAAQVYSFTIFSYQLLLHILQNQPQKSEVIKVVVQFLQQNLTNKSNVEIFLKVLSDMINQTDIVIPDNSSAKQINQQNLKNSNKKQNRKNDSQEELQKNISFFSQTSKIGGNNNIANAQLKFQQIKQKLTNPITIRLLANDAGIELAQKYYNDWLDQQFEKWVSPDHNYCTVLQSKLNAVLNFAKKKQRGYYKINSNSHVYDLFFIYKLPWIINVNQERTPLWVRQRGQSYQLYVNYCQNNDDKHGLIIKNDSVKIVLGIGEMKLDQQFNVINESDVVPLTIFLNKTNSKKVDLFGEKVLLVQSNGVQVYYRKYDSAFDKNALRQKKQQMSEQEEWQYYNNHVQDLNKIEILRIVINIKLPTVQHTQQLPLHLINQLIKTEKGRKFLEYKKFVDKAGLIISNFVNNVSPAPSAFQVRSTLWSLGFYGSRNDGIKILKQKGIFENIVKMTFHSPILSLRGTCRYILNMFAHSQHGRNLLTQNGFHVNSSCFTCYPIQVKKFYAISSNFANKKCFIMDQKYWSCYNSLQKSMNKHQQKLFQLISLLVNSLSFKTAVTQIREILKSSSKLSNSINLLQNVVNLLTFFKYKHESRKSITNVFQELIKSPDFNSETGNKIIFYVSQQQVEQKISMEIFPKSESNLKDIVQQTNTQLIKTQVNLMP